jgi:hypothetical protein
MTIQLEFKGLFKGYSRAYNSNQDDTKLHASCVPSSQSLIERLISPLLYPTLSNNFRDYQQGEAEIFILSARQTEEARQLPPPFALG